jgi:hypothetical protein
VHIHSPTRVILSNLSWKRSRYLFGRILLVTDYTGEDMYSLYNNYLIIVYEIKGPQRPTLLNRYLEKKSL